MKKSTFRLSETDYETIQRYFLDNFALILPSDITDQKLSRIELLCRDERIEGPLNLLTTNTRNDVTRGLSKLISIFTINHTDFFLRTASKATKPPQINMARKAEDIRM